MEHWKCGIKLSIKWEKRENLHRKGTKFADTKTIAQNQKKKKQQQRTISNCIVSRGGDFNKFSKNKTKRNAINDNTWTEM